MRLLIFSLAAACSLTGYGQALETVIQRGHELAVLAVAVSPDSNYIATASKDKSAKLWDVQTGRELRSFLGHESFVTSLEFTPDGKQLVTGGRDKTLRIWNVETGREEYTFATDDLITDVAVDPLGRFFLYGGYPDHGYGDSVRIYDLKTKRLIISLPASADKGLGSGLGVALSGDGRWLAIGEDNRKVTLYTVPDWKPVKTFEYTEGYCGGCGARAVFSANSKSLYIATHHGYVKKIDLASFKDRQVYEEKLEGLKGLAVSPDERWLAVSTGKAAVVWSADGKPVAMLEAESKGDFHEIVFAANSRELFISTDNNTVLVFTLNRQKVVKTFTGFLNTLDKGGLNYDPNFYWQSHIARYVRFKNTVLVTNDGGSLIRGKFGTKVKRWDVATGKTVMEYAAHKKAVLSYALSRDGQKLLTGGGDGTIILWDVQTGDSLQVIRSYREPIFDIHFNAEETHAISCSWDATVKRHDLKTGKLVTYLEFPSHAAYSILPHPNDLYWFTARLDNSVQLWDLDTRTVVRTFTGHTNVIASLRLSKDQRTLLTASWDGSVRLWDVAAGLMIKKFKDHRGPVHIALFSEDEQAVYSAGADRVIRVWDVSSGKVLKTFEGHQAEITSLVFSPDRKMLISHSVDGVTKFWDLSSGKEFFEHIHLGEKDWLVKNPGGYFNGTDHARKYIHFVDGVKSYAVDQFFHEFYRPDLLPRIFQNRGGDERKGIQGKLKTAPPPGVKVAIVPASEKTAEVLIRVTDNGGGVSSVRLLHNGKSIALDRDKFKLPSSRGESVTIQHPVNLVKGMNTFTVVAVNKELVESDPQSAEIFSETGDHTSTCYIVAVGINVYKNGKLSLNYAKPDAESFSQVLDKKGKSLFRQIELHTLYDAEATRSNILKKLDELADKVQHEDVLIFYYAGHGSMVDNRFYFVPTEGLRLYDPAALQKEAIEANVLQEKFKKIKALKQLIIMDACQSGASTELLATRGATEEKAIAQLSRSAGIHVMASAGSEQFATEFSELGHGLFTYVLIKALQGEADGAPKDGKITIYELKSYLDDQVPEMTRKLRGKPQYPYTFSRGHDFPVVINE